jgi:hypothetical protein
VVVDARHARAGRSDIADIDVGERVAGIPQHLIGGADVEEQVAVFRRADPGSTLVNMHTRSIPPRRQKQTASCE